MQLVRQRPGGAVPAAATCLDTRASITRHIALVMAALAIYAVTAALLKDRTDTQARHPPPLTRLRRKTPGMIPLTVPEIRRLLAAALQRPPGHATHWPNWRRRHQARSYRRPGSPTAASADPLGQGHDDSLRSAHVVHAPEVLVLTHAANQAVAVRGQPVDGRLKVVHLERHVAQS